VKLLTAPATSATPPAPTFLGALKNIGTGIYKQTAKFAGYKAASATATTGVGSRIGTNTNSVWANLQRVGMNFTAEDVSKNSAIAWAYLASRQNYCSSQMTYIPATGDNGLDKEITAYLHGYDGCGGKFATMGVDCSLQDAFMRTADIETPVRGDAGLIIHRQDDELRLIEFSADQLGEIYQFTMPRDCSLSRRAGGSLYESNGTDLTYLSGRYFRGCDCVAYRILQRTQSWYGNPVIYPASDVIYFRDPASYRGVRGVTLFANAIQHMEKGEDLLQAALSAAQRQARTYGRVFNNSGGPDEPESETSTDGRITFFEKVPNGPTEEFYYTGDQAEFAAPNTPSAEVISGVETADERVAIALRLNYAFLISATKVGGAPSRLEINKAAKEFARIQNQIHRPRLRRIADIVLMDAVRRGDIVPPRGMTGEQFRRGRWMLPISPSVDAFYDASENIKMLRAGLESAEDIIAETNRNADDVLMKSRRWAVKCAQTVEDANRELVAAGYKPSVTAADIAQVSDNPQQTAAAENIEQGKPAAEGNETDPKKQAVAALAEFDESKHSRDDAGRFGEGGGHGKASADANELSNKAHGDALSPLLHSDAAKAHADAIGHKQARIEAVKKDARIGDGEKKKLIAGYRKDIKHHQFMADAHGRAAHDTDRIQTRAEATLAEFDESKHERADDGKFSSGNDASAHADKKSKEAHVADKGRDRGLSQRMHRDAADAHDHAAERYKAEGKRDYAEYHEEKATEHRQWAGADAKEKRTAALAEFDESKHKRGQPGNAGQFGPGGGGGAKKEKEKAPAQSNAPEKSGKCDERCQRAKHAQVRVSAPIQQYADTAEHSAAKAMKGVSFKDSEPVDIVTAGPDGALNHGVEFKAVVLGANDKLTMNAYAQVRKIVWEKANKATFHTLVFDDRRVYNEGGKHDESKREIYYRRGVAGSARLGALHKCKDMNEAMALMAMDEKKLPDAAKRTDGKWREGRWKPIADANGKGFKNAKTGETVYAKK